MPTTHRDPSPTRRTSALMNYAFGAINDATTESALTTARAYANGVNDAMKAGGYIDDDTHMIRVFDIQKRVEERRRMIDTDAQARAGRIAAEYLD